jgi:uncharacterized phage protein (TIGR01671 family)
MNNYSRYTFKGKTKQGKWVYGNLLEPKRMYAFNGIDRSDKFCLIVECSFANGGWATVGTKHWVLKETLCQCTGLKDRDGNYIFENDIVSGYGNVFKETVEWNESFCGFYPFCNEETKIFADECKIIGNKFDKEVE